MTAERFGKDQHLRRGWEYKKIYKKGRRFHHPALTLVVYRREQGQPTKRGVPPIETVRLGLSVSRKVDRAAVKRNRLKRRLREIFRKSRLNFKPGIDMVVVPKAGAGQMSFADLQSAFTALCQRAGIHR